MAIPIIKMTRSGERPSDLYNGDPNVSGVFILERGQGLHELQQLSSLIHWLYTTSCVIEVHISAMNEMGALQIQIRFGHGQLPISQST